MYKHAKQGKDAKTNMRKHPDIILYLRHKSERRAKRLNSLRNS